MKRFRLLTMAAGIAVAVAAMSAQGVFRPERYRTFTGLPTTVTADTWRGAGVSLPLGVGASGFRLYLRLADLHANPGKKYEFTDEEGHRRTSRMPGLSIIADTLCISLQPAVETDVDDRNYGIVNILVNGKRAARMTKGIRHGSDNGIDITRQGNTLRLRIGYEEFKEAFELPIGDMPIDTLSLLVAPGGAIELLRADLTLGSDADHRIDERRDIDRIEAEIAESRHVRDGYWRIVGRSLDDRLLRIGGDYTLAMTTEPDGSISLWYYDGATINPSSWEAGRLKCRLKPRTPSVYDVEWVDPDGYLVSHGVTAWFDERTGALTIDFPYHGPSTLTLQKSHR